MGRFSLFCSRIGILGQPHSTFCHFINMLTQRFFGKKKLLLQRKMTRQGKIDPFALDNLFILKVQSLGYKYYALVKVIHNGRNTYNEGTGQ